MGSGLFRAGMRRLAGGVTIITSLDAEGRRCGITATAVCSLSTDPPSLVACVNRETSIAAVVEQRGVFAVHRQVARTTHADQRLHVPCQTPQVTGTSRTSPPGGAGGARRSMGFG